MTNTNLTDNQVDHPSFLIDGDSLFFQVLNLERQRIDKLEIIRTLASLDPSLDQLQNLYYIEARAAMVAAGGIDKNVEEIIHKWCLNSYGASMVLTYAHILNKSPISPSWIEIYSEPLRRVLKSQYPKIQEVEISVSMEPRFQARSISTNRIGISALTRTVLRHYNMTIWNLIEAETSQGQQVDLLSPPDTQSVARFILPYIIYSYDRIHEGRLPFCNIWRSDLFLGVLRTTKLQTMFILAHEFGHIVLGHLGHKSLTKTQKLQFEREADQFAYEAMLQVLQSEEESSTVGDLWTAVRWLYQYQLLDEIVGNLLANEDVVLDDLWLQQRKIDKPSLFPKDMSREDNVLECRGTMMLMSLKHELINLGREFLKLVSDELSTLEPGPNSSWWTKIANSGTSYVDPQFKGVGRTNDK